MPPEIFPVNLDFDMALNEGDRAWIREQIHGATTSKGWKRLPAFLRDFGVLAAIAVFVAMEWGNYREFQGATNKRLENIESQLREINATQYPQQVLNEIQRLPLSEFEMNLPALRKVIQQPPDKTTANVKELRTIADKLLKTKENTPDYWPTTLQFISFASANLSVDVPSPGEPNLTLTDVTDKNLNRTFGTISHKIVRLDGGSLEDGTFENCRIIFTNHLSKIRNVAFINCVFEFPTQTDPSDFLKVTSHKMLASDFSRLFI